MKNFLIMALATTLATPVLAGSPDPLPPMDVGVTMPASAIGGYLSAFYEADSVQRIASASEDGDYDEDSFTGWGVSGSVGKAGNGGFGWQLDADYSSTSYATTDYYNKYGITAHGNFGLGGMTVGAFVGGGVGSHIYDGDTGGDTFWYGVDAAKSFGNFALAAQLGFASADFEHNPLDSSGMLFGGVEARYFINDRIMITADLQMGTGTIHSATLTQTQYGIEGMMQLGQSNFYGTAGYRGSFMNADGNTDPGDDDGKGGESQFSVGVTMLFGGLMRDVYAGSTPMMTNELRTLVTINALTFD